MPKGGLDIRFAVGSQTAPRSTMYALMTSKPPKSDVYVTSRPLGGWLKASLHQSGHWQISLTSDLEKRLRKEGRWSLETRHLDAWTRPPVAPSGLTFALKIYIPGSELRVMAGDMPKGKPVIWVPAPPADHGVEFLVIFSSPHAAICGWPGRESGATLPLARALLPNGETLWLVFNVRPVAQGIWDKVAKHYSPAEDQVIHVKHESFTDPEHPGSRSLHVGEEQDGSRLIIETTTQTARALGRTVAQTSHGNPEAHKVFPYPIVGDS